MCVVDVPEGLVEGVGEDVVLSTAECGDPVQVRVEVEHVAGAAQGDVPPPQVLDGQLRTDAGGLHHLVRDAEGQSVRVVIGSSHGSSPVVGTGVAASARAPR